MAETSFNKCRPATSPHVHDHSGVSRACTGCSLIDRILAAHLAVKMARSQAESDPKRVARALLSRHSLDLVSLTTLQTLWAGYGHICSVVARARTKEAASKLDLLFDWQGAAAGTEYPLILKLIAPPHNGSKDEGHLRKMFSYEVEQYFYSEIAPRLGGDSSVARCLATTRHMDGQDLEPELRGTIAIVMTDLRPSFPLSGGKRAALSYKQVLAALQWLGNFHGGSWQWLPDDLDNYLLSPLEESARRTQCLKQPGLPTGNKLWLNGGYTYLSTRRKEYASLADDPDSEWSSAMCLPVKKSLLSVAEQVALFLTPSGRSFETYIHGDVKSENLFTNRNEDKVAFFDFQYVGLGLGVCDLAKLFTCSVPLEMLVGPSQTLPNELAMQEGEQKLLEEYRKVLLQREQAPEYDWGTFKRHWEAALVDWCRFQASWGFWGNTEWLEARVRSILIDQTWRHWLQQNIADCAN